MFSLICNLRYISLVKATPVIRCYAAVKTAESHGKFERLPPGFGKTTPFGLFIKENFASRKNEQPTEVFSNLTKQWKNLDEADKKKYVNEALRINEEKKSKFELMSEAEKEELRRQAKNLKEARLKRRIRLERREKRESDGQRPMSGWMLFVKEKAVKGAAAVDKKQQDIIRELAFVWKSLPKSDKDSIPSSAYEFYTADGMCFSVIFQGDQNRDLVHKMLMGSIVSTILVLVVVHCDDRELARLQIGIKKRVENCELRSRKGDTLNVHYVGMLENGTEFDNSRSRSKPFIFTLGMGQVIKSLKYNSTTLFHPKRRVKGWDQGLLNMCEGEQRRLAIPSDLAYGSSGSPPKIPPDASLKFDIELLKIEREGDL